MMEGLPGAVTDTESVVVVRDLLNQEKKRVKQLPLKIQRVYCKSRFEEKRTSEIAEELDIPKRTVEGYLLTSRKMVREYMRQCI